MEALVNQLVKALGWSIVHSLWQGAIAYALLFITFTAVPKMTSKLRHNVALASLFTIFASFLITFGSIFELPTQAQQLKNVPLSQLLLNNFSSVQSSFNLKAEAYFPVLAIVYLVGIVFQFVVISGSYFKLKGLKKHKLRPFPATGK